MWEDTRHRGPTPLKHSSHLKEAGGRTRAAFHTWEGRERLHRVDRNKMASTFLYLAIAKLNQLVNARLGQLAWVHTKDGVCIFNRSAGSSGGLVMALTPALRLNVKLWSGRFDPLPQNMNRAGSALSIIYTRAFSVSCLSALVAVTCPDTNGGRPGENIYQCHRSLLPLFTTTFRLWELRILKPHWSLSPLPDFIACVWDTLAFSKMIHRFLISFLEFDNTSWDI